MRRWKCRTRREGGKNGGKKREEEMTMVMSQAQGLAFKHLRRGCGWRLGFLGNDGSN